MFISSHDIDEVERLADWVGILNRGRLDICESVGTLQDRFRRVEVVRDDAAARLPPLPASWLGVEQAGKTLQFVESAFGEGAEQRVSEVLPGCREPQFSPMSLREIFLALARTYRISE